MKLHWPWQRRCRSVDTLDEARACYEQLEQRDTEIKRLGVRLRAAQRHNHFSEMVNEAIARTRET